MWAKLSVVLGLFLFGLLVQNSSAQVIEPREVRLNCSFEDFPIYTFVQYACVLRFVEVDFSNPFYYITINGQHQPNRTNADVLNLVIQQSNTNTIPGNIFQVFPNIQYIEAFRSGITSLRDVTLTFAAGIRGLFLNYNNITALSGSPFWGRNGVTHLNLYANGIETIEEGFFTGLAGLRYLSLGGNNLRSFAPDLFAPLVNLRHFLASANQIDRLSGRTFLLNRQIEIIALEYNNINSFGPRIFEGLNNLEYIGLSNNTCVSDVFEDETGISIDVIDEALQSCYENFVADPPRMRQLVFELRGNMTFFDEYNREILNVAGRAW